MDQRAQHLAAGVQFDQRELNTLVGRQRLAEGFAVIGVFHRLVDTVLGGSQAGGRLADAVLIEKVLDDLQAPAFAAEYRAVGHTHVGEAHPGVVGGHVEGPQVFLDVHARRVHGNEEGGDAEGVAGCAGGARHDHVALGHVHARVPGFFPVDDPVVSIANSRRFHIGGVRAVFGFGNTESEALAGVAQTLQPLGFLLLGAVFKHQQQADAVAHDGVLVLQIVVQAQAFCRKVLADNGHAQVATVAATELGGEWVVEYAGLDGQVLGLAQQVFPFLVGQALPVPVGAGVLTPVIEETDVVVFLFQRFDLVLDEHIQLIEKRRKVFGNVEIHETSLA